MRLGQISTTFNVPNSFQSTVTTSGRASELASLVSAITTALAEISNIVQGANFKAAAQARREAFLASMVNVRAALDRLATMLPSADVSTGMSALMSARTSLETAVQAARQIANEGAARRRAASTTPSAPSPAEETPAASAGMSTAAKVGIAAGVGLLAFGAIYYFTQDGEQSFAGTRALEGMGRCKNVMNRGTKRRMCWGADGKLVSNRAA